MIVKRYINSIFNSNTYLIAIDSRGILVDCGDIDNLYSDCLKYRIDIYAVFLSHCHFDHIYGLNRLLHLFPKIILFTNDYGKEALYSERLNYSRYHGTPFIYEGNNVSTISNYTNISLWQDLTITAFPTPGHSPCCISYLIQNYLFSGDSYIPGTKVVTRLKGADKQKAKHSAELIKSMIVSGITLCPGHGNIYTYSSTSPL